MGVNFKTGFEIKDLSLKQAGKSIPVVRDRKCIQNQYADPKGDKCDERGFYIITICTYCQGTTDGNPIPRLGIIRINPAGNGTDLTSFRLY